MTTEASGVRGFGLRVPESWLEFDVWRATRTGDLGRLVDRRLQETPELKPRRSDLLRMLRETANRAEQQGALFCAVMLDPVEDAGLLGAVAMVFQTSGSPAADGNSVEVIAAQVASKAPSPDSHEWRKVAFVDLPVGRAVRVTGVEESEAGVAGVVMQTLIPVPHAGGVLNVVLTSPQVHLAEPLLDLFDAISGTLTWTGPDSA